MTRYKLIIEYDGTDLCGWQRQNDMPTVQGNLEQAIESMTGEKIEVVASGRTDAGVHAIAQVVHFDIDKEYELHKIEGGLNHYLTEKQVSVISAHKVSEEFHARFSAIKRYYRYIILNRKAPTVLKKNRVWHVIQPLDIKKMQEAAEYLLGNHDFSSFRASECQSETPVKTLDSIDISVSDEEIYFDISARSFLHHMCRNIVGTLKEVGEGRIAPSDIKKIIEDKDRSSAGITAPAYGLYFMKVDY